MSATGTLMTIDKADFRRALGQFASGVTVVTTRDGAGRPHGLTASAFCSVSLEPPLVLVCIDLRSEAHDAVAAQGAYNVSILAEGQQDVSHRFAFGGAAKFEGIALEDGANGLPLVPGALAHLECRVASAHLAGDHTIYVGQIERLVAHPGRPLAYHAGGYRRLAPDDEAGAR